MASFQLFPIASVAGPAAAAFGFVVTVGAVLLGVLRVARKRALTRGAAALGLEETCSAFVGRALVGAPGPPASLVSSPSRLRAALAKRLGEIKNDAAADDFAMHAGWCLSQLGFRDAAFEGAPRTFDPVLVSDRVVSSPAFTAYVVDVDATSLTLITSHPCPYPAHTPLTITFEDGETIAAELELKPVTAAPEWVLSHTLDANVERREMPRTTCSTTTVMLVPCADVVETRRALRLGWPVARTDLETHEVWRLRKRVKVVDISADGIGLLTDDHAVPGDVFHLLLTRDIDDAVVGVPEFEIVRTTRDPSGQLRIGAKFMRLRLDERTAIADWIDERVALEGAPSDAAEPAVVTTAG